MTWLPLIYAVLVVFFAAIVRGFSGFGFSLLAITALSLVYAPAEIVPSIFMLEVAASLHLLPSIWKDVHWRSLLPLTIGCLIATPLGVWALASLPAPPMQLAMAVFVLLCVALMARGYALSSMPGPWASTTAGAASGLANGAFGIGGPPVVLFYFASPAGHAVGRASLIAFFLITDIVGLANQGPHGLLTSEAVWRAALFMPALVIGVWIGSRGFTAIDPAGFRRWVLAILAGLAIILAAKSALALLAA